MDELTRRTWAEISLGALENNYRHLRARADAGCRFLAVVKADAYGHGAEPVARHLLKLGAEMAAVACLDEAVKLREGGITAPILVLGYTPEQFIAELMENDITQCIGSLEEARALSEALPSGRRLRIHIKADTGMGRLGIFTGDDGAADSDILEILSFPCFEPEGIFTHFSVSDVSGDGFTALQYERFISLCERLERNTGKRLIRHCANSGAVINYPQYAMDMLRPGIATYGLYPEKGVTGGVSLIPAMQLKTRIVQIKTLPEGSSVSYGRMYFTPGERRIAVVPVGYADGFFRGSSNSCEMLLRGRRVPQVGRICMDMCMLDVTDVDGAAVGDVVTVFGRDGDEFIPVEEHAERLGTISYELVCAISPRVPRVYTD